MVVNRPPGGAHEAPPERRDAVAITWVVYGTAGDRDSDASSFPFRLPRLPRRLPSLSGVGPRTPVWYYVPTDIGTVSDASMYVKNDIREGGVWMVTKLGYALLGLLAREPLSGYDLAARLRDRVGYFWRARHSQIYPELARLEAAGLVRHERLEQDDRPDKKVYEPTDEGLDALRTWVTAPGEVTPTRDELLLKAYSIWLAAPLDAAALFREHERRHLEQLRVYERILETVRERYGERLTTRGEPSFGSYLALLRGIGYEREYAGWCAQVADALERDDAVPASE